MGETNQPIIQRDNALARKLAAIGQLNETYGTRAQGGAGAPIIEEPAPQAGAGTVLPPPPVPVTPEEEAELQRKFDVQWNTPKTEDAVAARTAVPVHTRAVATEIPEGFAALDLVNQQVVASNGMVYPITEDETKEFQWFAFKVMIRSLDQEVARVAKAMGVPWPPQREAVPEVPGDETAK